MGLEVILLPKSVLSDIEPGRSKVRAYARHLYMPRSGVMEDKRSLTFLTSPVVEEKCEEREQKQ